ncbi:lysophospholipid acyltransferase family protein [Shimia aestuarii]|uniref:lysophospholipid acyltransferase family protein n=1 Tax=Shimia aestuarii TaxID=254406 RepID=UPI001FB1B9AF|nr:lysophospholipid acyltransferase family protein [Shimia aestuarii]
MGATTRNMLGIRLRSALFYVLSGLAFVPFLLFWPVFFLPERYLLGVGAAYLRVQLVLLRLICGIRYRVEGAEHLPEGPCLIASWHESSWETLFFHLFLDQPVMFAKQEVFSYPVVGLVAQKAGHVPIDRKGTPDQMRDGFRAGVAAIKRGRKLLIFPSGTRQRGAPKRIQRGVGVLYDLAKVDAVPVQVKSGHCWPAGSLLKYPGTITVRILPPIPAGLERRAFLQQLALAFGENQDDLKR